MALLKWTTREFRFDFPAELFPFILERLRGTPSRIEELTADLTREQLTRKNGTAWSIQEHVGHFIDLDELHDGRIDDFRNKLSTLRAADMQNKKTYNADHNSRKLPDLIRDFRRERAHFISRLQTLDDWGQTALHPRLKKPMRVVDMAWFVAEHDDHHLALMRELAENYE